MSTIRLAVQAGIDQSPCRGFAALVRFGEWCAQSTFLKPANRDRDRDQVAEQLEFEGLFVYLTRALGDPITLVSQAPSQIPWQGSGETAI